MQRHGCPHSLALLSTSAGPWESGSSLISPYWGPAFWGRTLGSPVLLPTLPCSLGQSSSDRTHYWPPLGGSVEEESKCYWMPEASTPGGVSPLLRGIAEVLNGNNENWDWCWVQSNKEATITAPLLQRRARGSQGFCDLSVVTQLTDGKGQSTAAAPIHVLRLQVPVARLVTGLADFLFSVGPRVNILPAPRCGTWSHQGRGSRCC